MRIWCISLRSLSRDDLFATSMYSHVLNYSKKAVDPPDT